MFNQITKNIWNSLSVIRFPRLQKEGRKQPPLLRLQSPNIPKLPVYVNHDAGSGGLVPKQSIPRQLKLLSPLETVYSRKN